MRQKTTIIIYDAYDNDVCLGVFDSTKEAADYLNTTSHYIRNAINSGFRIFKRYWVEKICDL